MSQKVPISVLIMTKNEELNILHCLESIKWAAEIFIVDSHSTDNTVETSKRYTDKIIQFDWNGKLPKKKEWSLKNLPFSYEWVLTLDADEVAPAQLKDEISAILEKKGQYDGCVAKFNYYFLGKLIKHGDPVRKLIFFKHKLTGFEQLDDSGSDFRAEVEVHEHPIVRGQVGCLKSHIIHNDRRKLMHYFDRHNRYSTWEAFLMHRGKYRETSSGIIQTKLTKDWISLRRLSKYIFLRLPFKPLFYFIYAYIFRLGFLDGYAGFAYNVCKAFYAFQIGLKRYEYKMEDKGKDA